MNIFTTRFLTSFLWMLIIVCSSSTYGGGIRGKTLIATSRGCLLLKQLSGRELILGLDPRTNTLVEKRITSIAIYTEHDSVTVNTSLGAVATSSDYQFYDKKQRRYVAARDLRKGAKILTRTGQLATCYKVTVNKKPIKCYELTCKENEDIYLLFPDEAKSYIGTSKPIPLLGSFKSEVQIAFERHKRLFWGAMTELAIHLAFSAIRHGMKKYEY